MTSSISQPNPVQANGSRRRQVRRRKSWDFIILLSMLVLLMMLFLPVMVSKRAVSWDPPNKKSFIRSVQLAFSKPTEPDAEYTPTPIVSLSADYFTFGNDYLVFYRLHSLLAQLAKTTFLWLLLRRLRVAGHYAVGFAFLMAIWPSSIEAVMTPTMRGAIAVSLFIYFSLWAATHCESKHWIPWMVVCGAAGFISIGASLWGAILLPAIPAVAWWRRNPGESLKWVRLVIPEIMVLCAAGLSICMTKM